MEIQWRRCAARSPTQRSLLVLVCIAEIHKRDAAFQQIFSMALNFLLLFPYSFLIHLPYMYKPANTNLCICRAYAADGRVEWPFTVDVFRHLRFVFHEYHVRPILDDYKLHSKPCDTLGISGLLLPISIQTRAKRDGYEDIFPLHRRCNVFEWRKRHSEPQLQLILNSGRLVQTIQNSETPQSEKEPATTETLPESNLYGDFTADYRF